MCCRCSTASTARAAPIVLITHEPDVAARAKRVVRLADGPVAEDRRVVDVADAPPGLDRPSAAHRRDGRGRGLGKSACVIRFETLRLALGGLLANRLRSGLTILGLTIGVASVIILIAVGNGSAQTVQKRIESLGSNVLLVDRSFTLGGSRASNAATTPLTQQDVNALNDSSSAPDVASASPVVNANTTLVSNGVSYSPGSFVGDHPPT